MKSTKKQIIISIAITIPIIALVFSLLTLVIKKDEIQIECITVDTYICYTTDSGSKYHSGSCQYLWNSSHKTTVYEAQRNGFVSCSKCDPHIPITKEVESRNLVTVTDYETCFVWSFTLGFFVFIIVLGIVETKID